MRAFNPAWRGWICLCAVGVLSSQVTQQEENPLPGKTGQSGLVRMDLLRSSREERSPFRRNLFAPGPAYGTPSPPGVPVPQVLPRNQESPEVQPGEESSTEVVTPAFSLNLRYIGFIRSARSLVALILLDGQALAVAEGEIVSEGVRVGKISVDEIEVVLPDSSMRKFSLEGE